MVNLLFLFDFMNYDDQNCNLIPKSLWIIWMHQIISMVPSLINLMENDNVWKLFNMIDLPWCFHHGWMSLVVFITNLLFPYFFWEKEWSCKCFSISRSQKLTWLDVYICLKRWCEQAVVACVFLIGDTLCICLMCHWLNNWILSVWFCLVKTFQFSG